MNAPLTRRQVLAGSGALVVAVSLGRAPARAQAAAARLPASLEKTPFLDAWLRIDPDGAITAFTGKVELGQGLKTVLRQIAAEELSVPFDAITLVTADTARTPDEGFTAGSQSMEHSGRSIRIAAAQARTLLVEAAARRLSTSAQSLTTVDGNVVAPDGRRLGYGALVSKQWLHVQADAATTPKDPRGHTIVGRPAPRIDLPAKVTGGAAYVQDLRLPGMVHARVVRPPAYDARLRTVDARAAQRLPGVLAVVRDGSYLGVIAEREEQAITAMRALADTAVWDGGRTLPQQAALADSLQRLPSQDAVIHEVRGALAPTTRAVTATYFRPYQLHGSIGPSCAVGLYQDNKLTLWTHSQGVYPLRKAVAALMQMPIEDVRCIHAEGAGCYGHNGADDVAADAAFLARAQPGRPVRVQWMREQEHLWEPCGSAMVAQAAGAVAADGSIADWRYEVWSTPHSTRPGVAGNLLPAWFLPTPLKPDEPMPIPLPAGGGDRNAVPPYALTSARVVSHFIPDMPLRVSSLRSLGGYLNVFATESFMDELARAAAMDPVAFRLRHLSDERGRAVVTAAAERFGWSGAQPPRGHGRGFAYARYKNTAAYMALAVEVAVEHETGALRLVRAAAACDCGEVVNPRGVQEQIEGGIVQSLSWTLYEEVTFTERAITSTDWASYPILRFDAVPERIDVQVIDRPGAPFLGVGEAAQGPTAAALANALAEATGVRVRALPLTKRRVKAALGV